MKRAIYTIWIMAIVCGAIVSAAGNFTFNLGDFTIDANDPNDPYTLAEKKLYFLTSNPVPLELSDPNNPNSPLVQTMTDEEWFIFECRAQVEYYMLREVNRGKGILEYRASLRKVFKKTNN